MAETATSAETTSSVNGRGKQRRHYAWYGLCGRENELFVPNLTMWAIHNEAIPTAVCRAAGINPRVWGSWRVLRRRIPGFLEWLYHTHDLNGMRILHPSHHRSLSRRARVDELWVDDDMRKFRKASTVRAILRRAGLSTPSILCCWSRNPHVPPWLRDWLLGAQTGPRQVRILQKFELQAAVHVWDYTDIAQRLAAQHGIAWRVIAIAYGKWIEEFPALRRAEYVRYLFGGRAPDGVYFAPEWFADLKRRRSDVAVLQAAGSEVGILSRWRHESPDRLKLFREIRETALDGRRFTKLSSAGWRKLFSATDSLPWREREARRRTMALFERIIEENTWTKSLVDIGRSSADWQRCLNAAKATGGDLLVRVLREHVEGALSTTAGSRTSKRGVIWQSEPQGAAALYVPQSHFLEFREEAARRRKQGANRASMASIEKSIAKELGEHIVDEWMLRAVTPNFGMAATGNGAGRDPLHAANRQPVASVVVLDGDAHSDGAEGREMCPAEPGGNGQADRSKPKQGPARRPETWQIYQFCYEQLAAGKNRQQIKNAIGREFGEEATPKGVAQISTYAKRHASKKNLPWPLLRE